MSKQILFTLKSPAGALGQVTVELDDETLDMLLPHTEHTHALHREFARVLEVWTRDGVQVVHSCESDQRREFEKRIKKPPQPGEGEAA